MTISRRSLMVAVIASLVFTLQPAPVRALDKAAALCQQAIGKGGQKFKKAKLTAWQKCLDGALTGKGCDAVLRDQKIATGSALETQNRGKAATRWVEKLQGKKMLALVVDEADDGDQGEP